MKAQSYILTVIWKQLFEIPIVAHIFAIFYTTSQSDELRYCAPITINFHL